MSSFNWSSIQNQQISYYTTFSAFPSVSTSQNGNLAIAQDTGILYEVVSGSWAILASPGTPGTVTSVGLAAPAIFTVSGSPVTSAGTLTLSYSGTALPVINGGTGTTTAFTQGSVVFAGASGTYSQDNANFFYSTGMLTVKASGGSTPLYVDSDTSLTGIQLNGAGATSFQFLKAGTAQFFMATVASNEQWTPSTIIGDMVIRLPNTSNSLNITADGGNNTIFKLSKDNLLIGANGGYTGNLKLAGSTSGTISILAAAAAGTYNFNLPITAGTAGQVLTSQAGGSTAMTWTTLTTGTVTSVAMTVPSFLSVAGSPITSTGTLAVTLSGTALPAANGGTGVTSLGNFTDAGTDGIVITGGTGAVITSMSIAQHVADSTHNGYLSSTDWSTFNNKGSGTVTAVSVASANGFAGTSGGGTTPALTLTTTITGVLKGNATAISAATSGTDYSAGTSALATGILKSTTTTGALTIAVAGDFPTLNQNTTGSAATLTTARTINGTSFNGSADITVTAAAGTLTGATLNSSVTASSLTSVGTITTGTWTGTTIAIANGGTGQTAKAGAFDALSPMTTGGDIIYGGASGTGTRLANGSAGQFLKSNGTTLAPSWAAALANPMTTTGDMIYSSDNSGTAARLAIGATNSYISVVSGIPAWTTRVSFSANTSTTVSSTSTPIVYTAEDHDTDNAYNNSTGEFTVPTGKGGVYFFCVTCYFGITTIPVGLYVGGVKAAESSSTVGSTSTGALATIVTLNAGNVVTIRSLASATASGGATTNIFGGYKV